MILYRDERIVAVDKPSGLLVHRGWANDSDVLMMRVRDQLERYVYPIHRLDRGASGVVLFALDKEAARELSAQLQERTVTKVYRALVRGVPRPEQQSIDHPIPRAEGGERVDALTDVRCLEVFGRYAWVEARPRSGRLHQIRRHLKHISCPLIGDVRYGKGEHNRHFRERYGLHRLALHALRVELTHPFTGESLTIECELAPELASLLEQLRHEHPASSV
jgi:tRNA pseudouridine65 synthase